jgi:hypothetical protein
MPYAYAALDRLHAHLFDGQTIRDDPAPKPCPRGADALEKAHLGMPQW